MKKLSAFALLMVIATQALASDKVYTTSVSKEISKADAVKTLLANPKALVYECTPKELTDKVTLRNR